MRNTTNVINPVALFFIFIAILLLVACDNISADIKSKTTDLFQDSVAKVQQPKLPFSPQIATVSRMYASSICYPAAYCLYVELKPTSNVVPGKNYVVDLYEKGSFRDTTTVQWNQPEINVLKEKSITFQHLKQDEYNAYQGKDISHIFSINVHEETSSTNKHIVTGETSFQTLLSWGIPASEIEKVLGDKIPNVNTTVYTYSTQKYRDFLAVLSALQKLADKY
ncbi:MAG: hypothetical protein WC169_03395 [Dehalococcoidia bacterium]|jgi:hypothetical protein